MGMGIGKQYFVHVIKCDFGDLEAVIQFMKDNAPKSNTSWFEVRPIVHFDKNKNATLTEYEVSLVELAK